MDEKTEELRDIFVETTGSDTVTESQEESTGDLSADEERESAEDRLPELVATMRDRYDFASDLDDADLERVVRGYFNDESDADIADDLDSEERSSSGSRAQPGDVDEETVFTARMDLHLVRESDRDAPFDLADLRSMVVEDVPVEERVDRLDADEETVERYSQVVHADLRSTRANDRFRDEFAELLTDQDLEQRHAEDAHEDGLQEATEDIETDVSF